MNIIKIYNGIYGEIKAQYDNFTRISIEKDISDISTATISTQIISDIKELDRVEICNTDDTIIFSGFTKNLSILEDTMDIPVVGFKSLLQRKFITADITTTSSTSLMSAISSQWLAISGESITIDCPEFAIKNEPHSKGSSIYSVIESVCTDQYAFDFDILNRKIRVSKTLGSTIQGLYTYSPYHTDNNIYSVSLIDTENLRNVQIDFDTLAKTTIDGLNPAIYGVLAQEKTNEEYIGISKEYKMNIDDDTLVAGDNITVEILGNEYIEFYGTAYVVREKIEIDSGGVNKTIEVGTVIKKQKTISQILGNII